MGTSSATRSSRLTARLYRLIARLQLLHRLDATAAKLATELLGGDFRAEEMRAVRQWAAVHAREGRRRAREFLREVVKLYKEDGR